MGDNLFVLCERQSIANQFLYELRDKEVQKDRMRFRRNMERLGEILSYEISKRMTFRSAAIQTPLGETTSSLLIEQPVLVTILRAGLPFHHGFLNFFDHADSGFIGAFRNEGEQISVTVDYASLPPLGGRTVILIDPMLATGRSAVDAQKLLQRKGTPAHVHIVSVVAAPEGIRFIRENLSTPYSLWTCAVDEKLNSSYYIVPGLGDAGDLSFGLKT